MKKWSQKPPGLAEGRLITKTTSSREFSRQHLAELVGREGRKAGSVCCPPALAPTTPPPHPERDCQRKTEIDDEVDMHLCAFLPNAPPTANTGLRILYMMNNQRPSRDDTFARWLCDARRFHPLFSPGILCFSLFGVLLSMHAFTSWWPTCSAFLGTQRLLSYTHTLVRGITLLLYSAHHHQTSSCHSASLGFGISISQAQDGWNRQAMDGAGWKE